MLFRFSLYGFLKNQEYYDPFFILFLLEKGLDFAAIGLLIGFREIAINLLEIPTGALADVLGRRRCMISSMLAYIASFLIFTYAHTVWGFLPAMFLFSLGEAFRTGTHKAMIFDWLSQQGRAGEKTHVYGFTRSWSQIGSAVSVVIATVLVFTSKDYSKIFLFSIVPYVLNIVNFLTYPPSLDGPKQHSSDPLGVAKLLWESLRESWKNLFLRRLFIESMTFEGMFKVSSDYLQPMLKAAALALPFFLDWSDRRRTALLVGAIYFLLYLASSYASRHAGWLAKRCGSENRAARKLWWTNLASFAVLTAALLLQLPWPAIAVFVFLAIIQNFWRPILISRFADHANPAQTATVLSIESQGKSLFGAVMAPLIGWSVDRMPDEWKFLPVGVMGLMLTSLILTAFRNRAKS
jgi:MFS family permease